MGISLRIHINRTSQNETGEQEEGRDKLALHHERSGTCVISLSQKMKLTLTKKRYSPRMGPGR